MPLAITKNSVRLIQHLKGVSPKPSTPNKELKELIARWDDTDGNLILVTHYVIVGGALGYYQALVN